MDDKHDAFWWGLGDLGIVEVRKRVGAGVYAGHRKEIAQSWIEHQETLRSSGENASILAEARAANDLARATNELAEVANASALEAVEIARDAAISAALSASAARNNNIIATAALIAAVIAMAISIIGIFVR